MTGQAKLHNRHAETLRAQLAEAKRLVADGVTDEINLMKQLTKAQEQLAASQAEVERLEDLYNSDRVKYLEDITLLNARIGGLKEDVEYWIEISADPDNYKQINKQYGRDT